MASEAEKGLARKLLALRGRGSAVSNELAASARRVLDGQAQAGDMEAIRAHFNVGRSYAGKIRGVTGTVRRVATIGMNASRDLEMLQSGSTYAGARAVATLGLDVSQEIVRNRRTLIKIGESVAQTVGADPALASRFFNSLSRIAKVGGVVGAVAIAGFTAANAWFETMKAGSDAGRRMTESYFTSGNRTLASQLQERARGQVGRESVLSPSTGIEFLDDFFRARQERASSERMDQMMTHAKRWREFARPTGGAALVRAAAKRGVAVSDLTTEEVNAALDASIGKLTPTADEYSAFMSGKQQELVWWQRDLMNASSSYTAATYNEWANEFTERQQERYRSRMEAKARAEQETLMRMSATDRLQLLMDRDRASADFAAYRSRHKAVIPD